jgi:hypothetical protein
MDMVLKRYLWKERGAVSNVNLMFPDIFFGTYVLSRDRVVKKIQDCLASQPQHLCRSVYLSGCRGSGKTALLMILAKVFKAEGYEVYFFRSASAITQGTCAALESLFEEDKTKKVAVLIDEVASNPQSEAFPLLLRSEYPHVVTIGAAVPTHIPTGFTAVFRSQLLMSDLVLKEDDADFQELIQHSVGLNVISPELTRDICTYLLRQCGGHAYPTLAFIEYFLTSIEAKEHIQSMETFLRFFCGPVFAETSCYKNVRSRCFTELPDADTLSAAVRVLGGKQETGDSITLTRFGWWNAETHDFISLFLVNACLSDAVIEVDNDPIYLERSSDDTSSKETYCRNTERVIIAGLEAMEDPDFESPQGIRCGVKILKLKLKTHCLSTGDIKPDAGSQMRICTFRSVV